MRLLVRLLAAGAALLFTLVLVLVLVGVVLAGTERGLQWTYRIADALLPGELRIDELHGRLAGPLRLAGLRYRDGDTELALGRLELDWASAELLSATLHLRRFALDDLTYTYREDPTAADEPFTLPVVRLPFYLRIDEAELNRLLVQERSRGTVFELTRARLAASWDGDRGDIRELSAEAPHYRVSAAGTLRAADDYPLDLRVEWRVDTGAYAVWAGAGRLHGDLAALRVEQRITAPVAATLAGTLSDLLDEPAWDAELDAADFNLRAIHAAWPDLRVGGRVRSSGRLHDLQVDASGSLRTLLQAIPLRHEFALRYDKDILTLQRLRTLHAPTGAELRLAGRVAELRTQPRAELRGEWRQLRWPLAGAAVVQSDAGSFTLGGGLERYRVELRGDVGGPDIPRGVWTLRGDGDRASFNIAALDGLVLGGELRAHGGLRWQPALRGTLAWQGTDLNPGLQFAAWPGRIDIRGRAEGALRDGRATLRVDVPELRGELLDHGFEAAAEMQVDGERFELGRFELRAGDNRITASGEVDEQWDMVWAVDAEQLPAIVPEVAGAVHGSGRIGGPRAAPLISLSLRGERLRVFGYAAEELLVAAAFDSAGEVPSAVDLEAIGVTLGGFPADRIALRVDGTSARQQIGFTLAAPAVRVEAAAEGRYHAKSWDGAITRLTLDEPRFGRWDLGAPSPVAASGERARLEALCLLRGQGEVCASGGWQAGSGWQARLSGDALPLGLLQNVLPAGVAARGNLDFTATAQADAAGLVTGRVDVTLGAGAISQAQTRSEDTIDVAFRGGRLRGVLDAGALAMQLEFGLEDGGAATGRLRARRSGMPAPLGSGSGRELGTLDGRIDVDVRDLSVLPLFVTALENTRGQLTLGADIGGAWREPEIGGVARLVGGVAELPALGIRLHEIDITLRSLDRRHITVAGALRSGDGQLALRGDARLVAGRGWQAQLTATGERLEVVNTAEHRVVASPDLKLQLSGQRVELGGEVLIPEANMRPRELRSGAVAPSDDVVIVNGAGPAVAESRWQIYTQVRIRLGEFVRFNGFGLRARLEGDITLKDEPQQPTTAAGELRVVEGEYRAYGQELTIERGRLLFFGGPVDNPGLDVRAVRVVDEVTAGLLVRGTLKAPQVTIFSDPAMAETDALSYLVLGRPASQATRAEGEQMYGAAAALGLLGGNLLSSQLGRRFGIDDVRIESGGGFGEGALVIRHYLSPKIYVSYGMGLFENLNVFIVRYQISKLWALQAESGAHSSGDLIYTIERD